MHFIETYNQQLSLLGAFLILVAYMGHQFKWKMFSPTLPTYNIVNILGAFVLALVALRPFVVGFFILEIVWTAVSIVSLFQVLKKKK